MAETKDRHYEFSCELPATHLRARCGTSAAFQSPEFPSVGWATPYTYRFCFKGIERNAPVAVTTNGNRREKRGYMHGYDAMLEAVAPSAIICLGKPFPEMRGNIIHVPYDIYRRREVR